MPNPEYVTLPLSPDEIQWEQDRIATMRIFRVELVTARGVPYFKDVYAHYYNNDNPAGHWYFFMFQPSGRSLVMNAFGSTHVVHVTETTPSDVMAEIDAIRKRQHMQANGVKAIEQMAARGRSKKVQ